MFIEPRKDGDPFEVSDADTMLDYLDPRASRPPQIAVLTRRGCTFCAQAKESLRAAGHDFAEIDLPVSMRSKALGAIARADTVPQVFVDGERVGGSEQLAAWLRAHPGRTA
jgi:glutaredoxin-like protein